MNWKELFDEDRLDRGYNYYITDKVYDVVLTDDSITSKVEGSKSNIYEVKITFKEDEIDSLYCTCPYCYADFNCKHMVATLYKKEEIEHNTRDNIYEGNLNILSLFSEIIKNIDETKLRRFIYDKFSDDTDFMEEFIGKFQEDFTPEDFYNYESMLDNIFNIDVVELYNENGFYQETPFNRYLKSFIDDKISMLFKKEEYEYVLQLLYIIYENISQKSDVKQYIEVDTILGSCNYYLEKIIKEQSDTDNEEVLNYLLNKISYDYNEDITPYFINICITDFTKTQYLKQLDNTLDKLMNEGNNSSTILLNKYKLMKMLEYPLVERKNFLIKNKNNRDIMNLLVEEEISNQNIDNAIELLLESKEIHGDTYSLETNLLLFELYKISNDKDNAIDELKNILYDYNIKDMSYIEELKKLCTATEWNKEKEELIEFYEETYAYNFLNQLYLYEEDYDKLYENIVSKCRIETIEEYKEYIEDEHANEILNIYKNHILKEAMNSKNVSGYSLIIHYLNLMIAYKNSTDTVRNVIATLKNKYNQRKLFMEKLEEFEILNFLEN